MGEKGGRRREGEREGEGRREKEGEGDGGGGEGRGREEREGGRRKGDECTISQAADEDLSSFSPPL